MPFFTVYHGFKREKVANYKNEGYTDLEAYEKAMRKIGKDYGSEWRKL